jgi:hypothetical protein
MENQKKPLKQVTNEILICVNAENSSNVLIKNNKILQKIKTFASNFKECSTDMKINNFRFMMKLPL